MPFVVANGFVWAVATAGGPRVTLATDGDSSETVTAQVSKHDEFCIKHEELCIKNEEFCITNDEFRRALPR